MAKERQEILEEVFDISRVKGATAKWPKARKEPPIERTHPETTPDLRSGPFEPLDGWQDEEIGYEGER
jgi:hypothetical protein